MNSNFSVKGTKFKKIVLSVGVALALGGVALSAQAGTTVVDGNGDQVSYTSGNYNLGTIGLANSNTFSDLPFTGSFSDVFTFKLGTGTQSVVGITSFFSGITADLAPQVGLTLKLTSNSSVVSAVPVAASYVDLTNYSVAYGHVFSGLTAGKTYSLTVAGNDASLLGSNYAFQIAALPVPEPESYAMLLAGLGMIGTIVRRRKSTVKGS